MSHSGNYATCIAVRTVKRGYKYTQVGIRQNLCRWLIKLQTRDALITLRDRFRIRYFAEEIHGWSV